MISLNAGCVRALLPRPAGWGRRFAALAATLVLSGLVAACGGGNGPDVRAELQDQLGETWKVRNFKVTVKEDVGTKVDPRMQHRFEATISPNENLYHTILSFDGTALVEEGLKKGKTVKLFGTARSQYVAGEWASRIEVENSDAVYDAGSAMSEDRTYVVYGSRGYKEFVDGLRLELAALEISEEKAMNDYTQLAERLSKAQADAAADRQRVQTEYNEARADFSRRRNESNAILSQENSEINQRYQQTMRGLTNAQQQQLREDMRAEQAQAREANQQRIAGIQQEEQAALDRYRAASSGRTPEVDRINAEITAHRNARSAAQSRGMNLDSAIRRIETYDESQSKGKRS
ncbi:MAG: hypothetical protein ACK46Q_03020 [Hyphomonas sp.]